MYRDFQQWTWVRRRILIDGHSRKRVARETGISLNTIRKMLRRPYPRPYVRTSARGSVVSRTRARMAYQVLKTVQRNDAIEFLHALLGNPSRNANVEAWRMNVHRVLDPGAHERERKHSTAVKEAQNFVRELRATSCDRREFENEFAGLPDLSVLADRLHSGSDKDRDKAAAVLCLRRGYGSTAASRALGLARNTYRRYRRLYTSGGVDALFARKVRESKSVDGRYQEAVFQLLHEPPAAYGFNRTSWKLEDLSQVLRDKGFPLCRATLTTIIKAAGYRWRKARVALTSHDPEYRTKLERVQQLLRTLGDDDAFFSIDEYGPFAIKAKPGRALTPAGEQRVVQQFQRSRGCLILTAALELSSNQVTHFYSEKKNTAEMIRMLNVLVEQYRHKRRIYLSWDAASWHMSKKLEAVIAAHNESVSRRETPIVETAPLPAGAQFLNVIESVFSGMSRAIIHNSDYPTCVEAKKAIDRYFVERNAYFRAHPKRAGRRIWGKEPVPPAFSAANNCKDRRYR